jgi:hypothetical protein
MRTLTVCGIVLAFALLPAFSATFAADHPLDKGSISVGGGFRFSSDGGEYFEAEKGKRSTSFGMDPGLHYFVIPGLAIGGKVILSTYSHGEHSTSDYGIGPQLIYYFNAAKPVPQVKGSSYPFCRVVLFITKHDWDRGYADGGYTWMRARAGGGFMHMLSTAVAIFAEGAYEIGVFDPDDGGGSSNGNKITATIGITHFIY